MLAPTLVLEYNGLKDMFIERLNIKIAKNAFLEEPKNTTKTGKKAISENAKIHLYSSALKRSAIKAVNKPQHNTNAYK